MRPGLAPTTILITGAVGRILVQKLLAQGQEVRALTRRPEQAGLPEGADVVQGDLTTPDVPRPLDGITGRPGRTLAQWARDHQQDFVTTP